MNSKQLGDITEAACLSELLKRGYSVSVPFGDRCPYDLIVDDKGVLKKVQCKTGWLEEDCIRFAICSITTLNGKTVRKTYSSKDVDEFMIYCKETNKIYRVPNKDLPQTDVFLRLVPPKNNQLSKVRMAEDYEI